MEFTLLGAAALAGAAVWVMLWWEARHGNADRCSGNLWETALFSAMVGLFMGRLATMLANGTNPFTNPGDIMLVRGGVSTIVAPLATITVFLFISRKEPVAMADGISAAALAGLAGWHAGCLFRDACLGTATELPWAITQAGSSVGRHPVEVYAAALLAIAAVALAAWKAYRRPPAGVPTSMAVAVAAAVRLVTEPMRPSLGGGPVWFYGVALVAGLVAAAWFWRRSRRQSPA
jgi:prolipoprotein diacylglyceryltransferase